MWIVGRLECDEGIVMYSADSKNVNVVTVKILASESGKYTISLEIGYDDLDVTFKEEVDVKAISDKENVELEKLIEETAKELMTIVCLSKNSQTIVFYRDLVKQSIKNVISSIRKRK